MKKRTAAFTGFLVAALVIAFASSATGATMGIEPNLAPFVTAQVERAARRLAQEPCSQVLRDYRDSATGKPLSDVLAESNLTPSDYVEGLLYREGPSDGPCRQSWVAAYTSPRSHVVYICPRPFWRFRWSFDRALPVTILIHETLHTLGLGEDPPSSAEITARVEARCGR